MDNRSWKAAREGRRDNCCCLCPLRDGGTGVATVAVFPLTIFSVHPQALLLPRICAGSFHFDSIHTSSWTTSDAPPASPGADMRMTPKSPFPQEFSL